MKFLKFEHFKDFVNELDGNIGYEITQYHQYYCGRYIFKDFFVVYAKINNRLFTWSQLLEDMEIDEPFESNIITSRDYPYCEEVAKKNFEHFIFNEL